MRCPRQPPSLLVGQLPAFGRAPQPQAQQFALEDEFLRQPVQEAVEQLAVHIGFGGAGVAGVLFLAIGASAWASALGHPVAVPEVMGTLGPTLFTFSIGVMSGPSFFASLRRGVGPILAMIAVLGAGAGVAVVVGRWLGLDSRLVAGAFAGALTNTPALAAA